VGLSTERFSSKTRSDVLQCDPIDDVASVEDLFGKKRRIVAT